MATPSNKSSNTAEVSKTTTSSTRTEPEKPSTVNTIPNAVTPPLTPILQAAEQLAKVAVEHSSNNTLAYARDSLTELRHIHASIDKLNESQTKEIIDNHNNNIKVLKDSLEKVQQSIVKQTNLLMEKMDQQYRQERIFAARQFLSDIMIKIPSHDQTKKSKILGSFKYQSAGSYNFQDESDDLVLDMLSLFMKTPVITVLYGKCSTNDNNGNEFATKLVDQLNKLGICPVKSEIMEHNQRKLQLQLP